MYEVERIEDWRGADLVDKDGEKIGTLEEVYAPGADAEPGVGTVKVGTFRSKHLAFPLEGATVGRDHVRVKWSKEQIEAAPALNDDGEISDSEAASSFQHFGSTDSSGGSYVAASELDERRADAEAASARADELEADAQREAQRAKSEHAEADSRNESAQGSEKRREDALAEAKRLRSEAEKKG